MQRLEFAAHHKKTTTTIPTILLFSASGGWQRVICGNRIGRVQPVECYRQDATVFSGILRTCIKERVLRFHMLIIWKVD